MIQQPAAVWNAIAETQDLTTEWAAAMFPLPPAMMDRAIERAEAALTKEMGDARLAGAVLAVGPLVWEAEAVQRFVSSGHPLSQGLTVMETVQEAVIAASRDYALTTREQKSLEKRLRTPPSV